LDSIAAGGESAPERTGLGLSMPSPMGLGRLEDITLNPFRAGRRLQELAFNMAANLTLPYVSQGSCEAPAHVLFPQSALIVRRYLREPEGESDPGAASREERRVPVPLLRVGDREAGGSHPLGRVERGNPRVADPRKEPGRRLDGRVQFLDQLGCAGGLHSHVNFAVADTKQWEQSATYLIDTNPAVNAFVKNAGLGFAISYFHDGQPHDFEPDFIIRLKGSEGCRRCPRCSPWGYANIYRPTDGR
jgi:type III restriction enzyme